MLHCVMLLREEALQSEHKGSIPGNLSQESLESPESYNTFLVTLHCHAWTLLRSPNIAEINQREAASEKQKSFYIAEKRQECRLQKHNQEKII